MPKSKSIKKLSRDQAVIKKLAHGGVYAYMGAQARLEKLLEEHMESTQWDIPTILRYEKQIRSIEQKIAKGWATILRTYGDDI